MAHVCSAGNRIEYPLPFVRSTPQRSGDCESCLEPSVTAVTDNDIDPNLLYGQDGKGAKDRVTVLPQAIVVDLQRQIEATRMLHERDLAVDDGEVWLPYAYREKNPAAETAFIWQYLFPATGEL